MAPRMGNAEARNCTPEAANLRTQVGEMDVAHHEGANADFQYNTAQSRDSFTGAGDVEGKTSDSDREFGKTFDPFLGGRLSLPEKGRPRPARVGRLP